MQFSVRRFLALLLTLSLITPCAFGEIVTLPMDFSAGMPLREKYEQGKMEYEDPSIHVIRERVESEELYCTYYVAYITIANPSQLRTESAYGFDSSMRVEASVMARRTNAVVAINGDYYSNRKGYVLRQGTVYRDFVEKNRDLLLIDEDGDFHLILSDQDPAHMDKTVIDGKKVVNAFEFGPALIKDGEICYNKENCPDNVKPHERARRSAICQLGPLEYMIVACSQYGLDMENFVKLIYSLGDVQQAYNLDGGNSVQMIFMGRKVNNTSDTNVRPVPDIIYFASAYDPD